MNTKSFCTTQARDYARKWLKEHEYSAVVLPGTETLITTDAPTVVLDALFRVCEDKFGHLTPQVPGLLRFQCLVPAMAAQAETHFKSQGYIAEVRREYPSDVFTNAPHDKVTEYIAKCTTVSYVQK